MALGGSGGGGFEGGGGGVDLEFEFEQCFSGQSTVHIQGQGRKRMDQVQVGDTVLTMDGSYSRVNSFGHLEHVAETDFLQISLASLSRRLHQESYVPDADKAMEAAPSLPEMSPLRWFLTTLFK